MLCILSILCNHDCSFVKLVAGGFGQSTSLPTRATPAMPYLKFCACLCIHHLLAVTFSTDTLSAPIFQFMKAARLNLDIAKVVDTKQKPHRPDIDVQLGFGQRQLCYGHSLQLAVNLHAHCTSHTCSNECIGGVNWAGWGSKGGVLCNSKPHFCYR